MTRKPVNAGGRSVVAHLHEATRAHGRAHTAATDEITAAMVELASQPDTTVGGEGEPESDGRPETKPA